LLCLAKQREKYFGYFFSKVDKLKPVYQPEQDAFWKKSKKSDVSLDKITFFFFIKC
jgi:hypothetical protein